MNLQAIYARISERLAATKQSAAGASKAAGLSADAIRNIKRAIDSGKPAGVSASTLSALAPVLQTTTAYLLEGGPAPAPEAGSEATLGPALARTGGTPPFGGFPQAGNWAAVDEYFQQDTYDVPEFVQRNQRYPKVHQYAYQVRGNSMNKAGIEDGMWVVAANALEFVDTYRDTESGDLVVVERTRFDGAERELTIKEVRYYRDRMELLPHSTEPHHKPIVVPLRGDMDDGVEVRIIGVVLTSYRDHVTRR